VARSGAPLIVYVVDDDDAVRRGFTRLLRSAGLDARPYELPELFLAEVENLDRACILLDITMPRMAGPQVQAGLNARNITLPVNPMPARYPEHTRARAQTQAARLLLRMPVDDQALLDAIRWVTDAA